MTINVSTNPIQVTFKSNQVKFISRNLVSFTNVVLWIKLSTKISFKDRQTAVDDFDQLRETCKVLLKPKLYNLINYETKTFLSSSRQKQLSV